MSEYFPEFVRCERVPLPNDHYELEFKTNQHHVTGIIETAPNQLVTEVLTSAVFTQLANTSTPFNEWMEHTNARIKKTQHKIKRGDGSYDCDLRIQREIGRKIDSVIQMLGRHD